jgi:hypothetical protein
MKSQTNFILTFIFAFLLSFKGFATVHTVNVSNVLSPDTLSNVYVGDTIRWEWISEGHSMMFGTVPSGQTLINFQLNISEPVYEYIVPAVGEYSYTCYPHGNFKGYFNAQPASGIQKAGFKNFSVFPNPTVNEVVISVDKKYPGINFVLFDITGKQTSISKVSFYNNNYHINLQDQLPGLYFIKASANNKVLFEKKIIKL